MEQCKDFCKAIHCFPGYLVSDHGCVCNNESRKKLALVKNQHGIVYVGMSHDFLQYKRGVTLLVAKAFLPDPVYESFDTPINLDGNRTNNDVDNLMWRPRWFAFKYNQQFYTDPQGINVPIVETRTGERFNNSWEAAIKYGLLDQEILTATMNRTYVWPTYQMFEIIEE